MTAALPPLAVAFGLFLLSVAVAAFLYRLRVNGLPWTQCPGCSSWMKRRYVPARLSWRLYTCYRCGEQWKRAGTPPAWTPFRHADALQLRQLLSASLAEGALEPVVDMTTSGVLLGWKRSTDPLELVKPVEKKPVFAHRRKSPVPPRATMLDRLLQAKREVHSLPERRGPGVQETPSPLWDQWIDG